MKRLRVPEHQQSSVPLNPAGGVQENPSTPLEASASSHADPAVVPAPATIEVPTQALGGTQGVTAPSPRCNGESPADQQNG